MHKLLNEKGQAFDTYKLLIGAIMGLLVLLIIFGAIKYFDGLRQDISNQRFFEGLKNATKLSNGETLQIKDIALIRDSRFTTSGLAQAIGVGEQCLDFLDKGFDSFTVESGSLVIVNQDVLTNVEATCKTNTLTICAADCEICCEISFEPS